MITYPVWAISETGSAMIESLSKIVARIEATGIDAEKLTAKLREQNPIMTVDGDVAVIDVQGLMLKRESIWTMLGFATSTETITAVINEAASNKKIGSVVYRVDSPGGTVDGQHKMVSAAKRLSETKPTFTQVDGEAASAAYWLASQSRKMFSGPGDLTGSIGVRMMLYDLSRAFANEGIEAVPIDTGKFKSAGAFGTEITTEQREYFQAIVDDAFADFLADVRAGRRMSQARAAEVGDGRLFTARQSLDAGLIDGIQDMDATMRMARRAAGRSTDTARARARMRDLELA